MDMKNVFLHGDLSEEIYMEQPHGFIQNLSLVCRLKKSRYGLKQVPIAWTHDSLLILVLYVDDILITSSSTSAIAAVNRTLHDRFLMTDMGPLFFSLGLDISQDATYIKLSQANFQIHAGSASATLKSCQAHSPICARNHHLRDYHAAGTALNLLGFTDSDWAGDIIGHKSTSRYSLSLGSSPICWSSKMQVPIALSLDEAEYKGVVNITIQALWLQHFLTKLGVQFHQPTVI
eukprot:PITA_09749